MNNPIAEGYAAWLNAQWVYHCPLRGPDGRACHRVLDEFTTHTMLCDDHGTIDKDTAIPWALCELQS